MLLNCMAIFFIIQIDEELYTVTNYESDNNAINFTKWIISVIYCKYFPEYEKVLNKNQHVGKIHSKNIQENLKKEEIVYVRYSYEKK